jgi:hypothetical protein
MGDGADLALSEMMDFDELMVSYHFGSMTHQEAYEHGIIDELGYEIGTASRKPSGPGACPKCGHKMHTVKGKFGRFWGCNKFPECKGSRNYN